MQSQGTQGPESFDERVNNILKRNPAPKWKPQVPPPLNDPGVPIPDRELGPRPPYGPGRDIRGVGLDGLFGVPTSSLQHMAGQVLYPSMDRFLPPTDPAWVSHQRFENTGKPAGYQNADPNAVFQGVHSGQVIPLVPKGW